MADDLQIKLEKLTFEPNDVLLVRVPNTLAIEAMSSVLDRIFGCIQCLPKDKAPKGILVLPDTVQLDQLKDENLSPEIKKYMTGEAAGA